MCSWVISTASTLLMLDRIVWSLNSGPVSTISEVSSVSTQIEHLYLWFRGSPLIFSLPNPPATGTPIDVPVPKKVHFMISDLQVFNRFTESIDPRPKIFKFFSYSRFNKNLFSPLIAQHARKNSRLRLRWLVFIDNNQHLAFNYTLIAAKASALFPDRVAKFFA